MKKLIGAFALGAIIALSAPMVSAETPKDTLVQAWRIDDIISLDPGEMFEISTYELIGNVYDTLVELNVADTSIVNPKLAASWSVSDDGKTFTFNLRKDAKFHSGNPVTAHDVVYSFARLAVLNKGPAFLIQDIGINEGNWQQSLNAVDDYTFQMTIDDNYAPSYIYNLITAGNFVVIDSKTLKAKTSG